MVLYAWKNAIEKSKEFVDLLYEQGKEVFLYQIMQQKH